MSGKRGGVHKLLGTHLKEAGVNSPAPFLHCASHNLNLLINDAVQTTVKSIAFFDLLGDIFNFFGRNLNRWAELARSESTGSKLKLKKLCPTRWSSRIEAVRAIKNRYTHICRVLMRISIHSTDANERYEAGGLKKRVESFEFLVFIEIREQVLSAVNRASVTLQTGMRL